jgi:ADP-heptose:LPS heptosyltransferase
VAGLAAVATGLRLLVGNDSGPMQLAACVGIPVVALFGPTDPGRTSPLGCGHDEVEAAAVDLDQQRQ